MPRKEEDYEGDVQLEQEVEIKKPSLYRVFLLNDDYTTMDFVVLVLQRFFHKSEAEANHIMLTVHKKGKGVAGIYTYEIAEAKVHQVLSFAQEHRQPLQCTMEEQE